MSKRRLAVVTASDMTVTAFLVHQLRALTENWDVTVIVNTANPGLLRERDITARLVLLGIERKVSLGQDSAALVRLVRVLRKGRFDLVYSITPKAGLLAMMAGFLAGTKCRIHIFTGQVWATKRGLGRFLLKSMDRLLAACATRLLADSESQARFLVDSGVVGADRISVLANGSISGVDLDRFFPDTKTRSVVREELDIHQDSLMLLFLGRLNPEKGILELVEAFTRLVADKSDVSLVLVGPDEASIRKRILLAAGDRRDRIRLVDFAPTPERYMKAADVFCLPSYREGFGSVIIEAAATGVPAVGSDIYGVTDAIENGVTGLLVTPRDPDALYVTLKKLVDDPVWREQLGNAARERARALFSRERLTQALTEYLDSELKRAEQR